MARDTANLYHSKHGPRKTQCAGQDFEQYQSNWPDIVEGFSEFAVKCFRKCMSSIEYRSFDSHAPTAKDFRTSRALLPTPSGAASVSSSSRANSRAPPAPTRGSTAAAPSLDRTEGRPAEDVSVPEADGTLRDENPDNGDEDDDEDEEEDEETDEDEETRVAQRKRQESAAYLAERERRIEWNRMAAREMISPAVDMLRDEVAHSLLRLKTNRSGASEGTQRNPSCNISTSPTPAQRVSPTPGDSTTPLADVSPLRNVEDSQPSAPALAAATPSSSASVGPSQPHPGITSTVEVSPTVPSHRPTADTVRESSADEEMQPAEESARPTNVPDSATLEAQDVEDHDDVDVETSVGDGWMKEAEKFLRKHLTGADGRLLISDWLRIEHSVNSWGTSVRLHISSISRVSGIEVSV